MTRIASVGRTGAVPASGRAAPHPGFVPPQPGPESPPRTGAASPTGAVQGAGMLAVQEWQSDAARDREARRRGEAILAALSGLQRALLGQKTDEALDHLVRLAAQVPEAADPGLAEVVRAVALRAQVEIARAGRRAMA